ncbi:MAG: flagellar basal body rod protein FlgB [Planctomycetota bacterium]
MEVRPNSEGLLLRLLDASTERQRVIANNLANQNTPGFIRNNLLFEELVAEQMQSPTGDPDSVEFVVAPDDVTPTRSDGNNVTPELEQVADQQNRLRYETYITILQGQYSLLQTAITGGN